MILGAGPGAVASPNSAASMQRAFRYLNQRAFFLLSQRAPGGSQGFGVGMATIDSLLGRSICFCCHRHRIFYPTELAVNSAGMNRREHLRICKRIRLCPEKGAFRLVRTA